MKPFEAVFPDLLPHVPGCPEPVAENAILRATQRFCDLTRAWVRNMDPIYLGDGQDTYDIELEPRTELVRIEWAKLGGREITVATPGGDLGRNARYIACDDGKTVHLNPIPSARAELVLRLSLKPANNAMGIEDFLVDRHVEVIALGARGLLKQHPKKTYSAADGLNDWQAFQARCSSIRNALWRGLGRNTPRTQPNWF